MAISFCDEFNISLSDFKKTEALNIILDIDTQFFIDPYLIKTCKVKEFENAENIITEFFEDVKSLILASKHKNDIFWKKADKLLSFKEYPNTCLGYSGNGTNGNAIGIKLRDNLIEVLKELLVAGQNDIRIFELLGLFQEGFGSDRISDLITHLLLKNIITYTDRITKELGIKNTCEYYYNNKVYELPFNKYNNKHIFLLPKVLLSPLPVAYSYADIDFVCSENERVRNDINQIIDLGNSRKLKKEQIRQLIQCCPSFKSELLTQYINNKAYAYDFDKDDFGRIIWYEKAKEISQNYPFKINNIEYTESGVQNIVEQIISQFKHLIENNSLYKLLYNDDGSKKREEAIQLLFFGIADKYCQDNNIDCSREINNGRGPVDFKFSKGCNAKVIVEIKWSTNNLEHGYIVQLPIYMKQENSHIGYYIVVNNGGNDKKLNNFNKTYAMSNKGEEESIKYVLIDGRFKESASIAKN